MRHPLLAMALAFLAGDLAGLGSGGASAPGDVWLALGAGLLLLLLGVLLRRRLAYVLVPILLASAVAGFAAARHTAHPAPDPLPPEWLDRPLRITGTLIEDPRPRPNYVRLRLRLERTCLGADCREGGGGAQVAFPLEAARWDLRAGERIRFWGPLRRPRSYGNPGAFDYAAHLRREGVLLAGSCKSLLLAERMGPGDISRPRRALETLRRRARAGLHAALPREHGARGTLEALLLGERSGIDPAFRRALTRGGAAHLLAVSGLHVGLLALLLHGLCRRLGAGEWTRAAVTLGGVLLYAGLAGGRPPLLRASLAIGVVVVGRLLYRGSAPLNTLGAAALLLLAADPRAPLDPSFRLTFAAAAGIILLLGPLEAWLERCAPILPGPVRRLLACTLAAQAATLPESVRLFGLVAAGGPLVNLVAVPAAALLVPGAALTAVAGSISPVAGAIVSWPLVQVLRLLHAACDLLGDLAWEVPPPPLWLVFCYVGCLLCARLCGGTGLRRTARAGFWMALFLICAHPFPAPQPPPGMMWITALDVGQGDSVLLMAGGATLLVDAGGALGASTFDLGERVVVPALRHLGVRRLSALVLTHPDHDHVGGAPAVLRALEVGAVWRPQGDWSGTGWEEVERVARARQVPVRILGAGDLLKVGPLWVEVLWPREADGMSENDRSLVLALRLGRRGPAALLMGDMEEAGERALLEAGLERAAVLKVGHHGSRTSTTPAFLERVAPRAALVSAGVRNPWGHPHAEVLDRLQRRHAVTLRTDRDGALRVTLDGEGRVTARPLGR